MPDDPQPENIVSRIQGSQQLNPRSQNLGGGKSLLGDGSAQDPFPERINVVNVAPDTQQPTPTPTPTSDTTSTVGSPSGTAPQAPSGD